MVKRQNRVNDPACNAPRPSGGNRKESITSAHSMSGLWDADESPAYTGHLHATNQRTASARHDANGAHQRMTIMK